MADDAPLLCWELMLCILECACPAARKALSVTCRDMRRAYMASVQHVEMSECSTHVFACSGCTLHMPALRSLTIGSVHECAFGGPCPPGALPCAYAVRYTIETLTTPEQRASRGFSLFVCHPVIDALAAERLPVLMSVDVLVVTWLARGAIETLLMHANSLPADAHRPTMCEVYGDISSFSSTPINDPLSRMVRSPDAPWISPPPGVPRVRIAMTPAGYRPFSTAHRASKLLRAIAAGTAPSRLIFADLMDADVRDDLPPCMPPRRWAPPKN